MGRLNDLTGRTFHRLTVMKRAQNKPNCTAAYWECRCRCGQVTAVLGGYLTRGLTRSCGCLKRDLWLAARIKHARSGTPEYRIWRDMKRRCYNQTRDDYPEYGGRGITVDEKWRNDFAAFFADMGPRPRHHELDRIDNNGPYAPSNCRWVSHQAQVNNSRHNHYITYQGVTLSVSDWARKLGLTPGSLMQRLNKLKWGVERALTTPQVIR